MEKYFGFATIKENKLLATNIYSMLIECKEVAKLAKCGQFINIYCKDESRLLPRPISICDVDKSMNLVRVVYRVCGKGTDEFSKLEINDKVKILGPNGNGFPIEKVQDKKVIVIGGGIGIPPMLYTAKEMINQGVIAVNGYRDNELFLNDEFESTTTTYVATEDGSVGTKGNVLDLIRENKLEADVIFACGPMPMLRAIKEYAKVNNIEAYISLEEKMACGIGACLACVCGSKEKDSHTNVNNKRICKEGPVFNATEIEF